MSSPVRDRQVLRPSQLNALARDLLEGSFPQVWVEGEVSNFSRPASGHCYFTLKDERAQVRCALFRVNASRLRFLPRDGMQVLARGRLTLYEARGDCQLVLDHLEEAGEGALRRAFEQLKARLAAEGLFDGARKRPLPTMPHRLGVLTSPHGAAVHDVLTVLGRRFPLLEVEVLPVPVQGEGAAAQILAMLAKAGHSGRYDILLLTRGGGSLEDLWAFNDEALVRAIAACPVPVVSAVGHEVDVSLADFAADLRAPTPSAAAEMLAPDAGDLATRLRRAGDRLHERLAQRLATAAQRSDQAWLRLRATRPQLRLERGRHRLEDLRHRLAAAGRQALQPRRDRLAHLLRRLDQGHPQRRLELLRQRLLRAAGRLDALPARLLPPRRLRLEGLGRALAGVSPLATLQRGYAILQRPDGRVLTDSADAQLDDRLTARLARGSLQLRVERKDR
ncbi:exodeoxyribonuclease VII large subunit [Arenimonas fontis]|uniref:Exodeoxyribonuclease 7 large subunit n=1 Tax=Arenimonas fontis TaxID=2608255 RepID=A0A5B2ZEM1_9GAMM|nr:exodeoxyribonuclease VII large subunit [Arenimonas fontis]KAA2285512.1 exodeoxyribonuclease VII large subunit [Arenimonas fontis]